MPITVPNGQAAVVIRHVADTGVIKLVVDGATLPGTLANGATENADTAPGTHHVVVESTAGAVDPVRSIRAAAGRPGHHALPDRQPAGQDTGLGGDD